MYQSKLHTEHNKNLLALVCSSIVWLLSACVWMCGRCVCVCVLYSSANPLTLRVVNLPTLRRENLFLLLCRRVEGLSPPFALSMVANRDRVRSLARRRERRCWLCAHCKAACMTACVAYNYKSRAKKGNICYPKQNGCTTILVDFQLRAFAASPAPSRLAPSHGLLYSHFSCALRALSISTSYIEIFISKAKMRANEATHMSWHHVRTLMYFLCLCFQLLLPLNCARYIFRGSSLGKIHESRQKSRGMWIISHHS